MIRAHPVLLLKTLLVLVLASLACADIFLHNPRGSNNRFRGDTNNQARLFDSQNNNNGGYGWGPTMIYYEGSMLSIEFVADRGCGAAYGVNCEIILQYMCSNDVRDGETDETPPADIGTFTPEEQQRYGYHEPVGYFRDCNTRQRNHGLFTADQSIGDTAVNTRQNDGGTRRGFECDEERDYYPYWHPSPWRDIAVLTSNTSRCAYYQQQSQNVLAKGHCVTRNNAADPWGFGAAENNPSACAASRNRWVNVPAWGISAPECLEAPNLHPTDDFHRILSYNWSIPSNLVDKGNCVLRIRYNITSEDYDGWAHLSGAQMIDSAFNGADGSPIKKNPTILLGRNLTFTADTRWYGRTFQDRSHVFRVAARPPALGSKGTIWNLNVRGRRGNYVQAYPALEYGFVPQVMTIERGDFVHYQWTGSDTNHGGQSGNGRDRTDRSNIVQIEALGKNYPLSLASQTMFPSLDVALRMATLLYNAERIPCTDKCQKGCCRTRDQQDKVSQGLCPQVPDNFEPHDQQIQNCALLNSATPYFNQFPIQYNTSGTFYYMSTRNNAFSNRAHKGVLNVR